MPTQVTHFEVIRCDQLKILATDIEALKEELGDVLPALNLLDKLEGKTPDAEGWIAIDPIDIYWEGDGAGDSLEEFETQVLPKTMGRLEAVIALDTGVMYGLRSVDGEVEEPPIRLEA